ncbi:MAG: DNA repair protein RecO [Deltaproteobacteria bacterium]|nr:DNA repair protein RecO [Deltaproteobacteria bacterium]MBK8237565.1 DNA repair protein RecO [Deltaproteobacteria bacterium]MBK8719565.1 DNA repair protein RecO [Deltaproteobacteria bacterium]MBP7287477.1 DNA repair protein RecO [Nannocystaceae bacterium]
MNEPQRAVLLRALPLGEADLVVVLLTERHGKVRAAARSARRSRRRFAGGLSTGALGRVELHRGRAALWRLDGFVPELDHAALGRDLDRFAFVSYLCELTDALLDEQHAEPEIFEVLAATLTRLVPSVLQGPATGAPDPIELRRYELALLLQLGHAPSFDACCVCGDPVAGAAIPFDAARGGALCELHGRGAPIEPGEVLAAAVALGQGAELAPLSPISRRRLRDLVSAQLRAHLRQPLRSVELFTQLAAVTQGDAPGRAGAGRVEPDGA